MKRKDIKVLRSKTNDELKKEVAKRKVELTKLNAERLAGKSINPKETRKIKKEIAVMKTLLTEKKIVKLMEKPAEEKKGDK